MANDGRGYNSEPFYNSEENEPNDPQALKGLLAVTGVIVVLGSVYVMAAIAYNESPSGANKTAAKIETPSPESSVGISKACIAYLGHLSSKNNTTSNKVTADRCSDADKRILQSAL